MKVLITGDSNTGALKRAQTLLVEQNQWPDDIEMEIVQIGRSGVFYTEFFIDQRDHVEIVKMEKHNRISRLPRIPSSSESELYGICAPFFSSRIWRNEDWARFAPITIAKSEFPISKGMFRQIVLDDKQYVLSFIDTLQRVGAKLFVVEAPRPFRHHQAFDAIPKATIAYVDQAFREVIREELDARSVPVVSIPSECYGEDGLMLDVYHSDAEGDVLHGNAEFGRLMLQGILVLLKNMN